MRVGFVIIGGPHWTGGVNYLINLLSALAELPDTPIERVFLGADDGQMDLESIRPYLSEPPILSDIWAQGSPTIGWRRLQSLLLQRDVLAEHEFRRAGVDVVFHHCSDWYGCRFGIPNMAWIADFQHRRLPQLFSRRNYWKRNLGYGAIARCARTVVVSSEDARRDCEAFFPTARGRVAVLPFAIRVDPGVINRPVDHVHDKYGLPQRFIYMPNQFWRQKNHLGVLEALQRLEYSFPDVVVVASGNLLDTRDPDYPKDVIERVRQAGLQSRYRILGMIPHEDVIALMRASVAVINPSFFEGWSTPVEEAKSFGVRLLLSDLGVHREQAPDNCRFFDPADGAAIAEALSAAWQDQDPLPREARERAAYAKTATWREQFGRNFVAIAERTAGRRR